MNSERVNISDLSDKVLRGLKKALRKLVETSAANNRELVIGDKHGNFKSVPAKDLLKDLPE
jgi:phage gp16-like protein